jgi:hypothetical protein
MAFAKKKRIAKARKKARSKSAKVLIRLDS